VTKCEIRMLKWMSLVTIAAKPNLKSLLYTSSTKCDHLSYLAHRMVISFKTPYVIYKYMPEFCF